MSFSGDRGAIFPGLTLNQAASTTSDLQKGDVQMVDESDYEPSEASSYDPAAALLDNVLQPSKKRRQSPHSTSAQQFKKVRLEEAGTGLANSNKSQKLLDRSRQLPGEIWQHIFTLVSPRDLGRLLTVNKLFHVFLSPSVTGLAQRQSSVPSSLPTLKPDAIWQASRRLHWPRMPAPLKGKPEVQMWRLVCSTSCQFCGSEGQTNPQSSNTEAWRTGPGPSDVCPIFPFCVFTCGGCLKKNGVREIDLLLSSTFPSFLLPALPPVLVDGDMHAIPPRAMQAGAISSNTQVTKLFWAEHVEQVKAEFESVKALGPAAAEEWIKGLEIRGKQILVDASRWEKWAAAGGIAQLRVPAVTAKADVSTSAESFPSIPNKLSSGVKQQPDQQQPQTYNKNEQHGPVLTLEATSQQPHVPTQQKRTREEAAQLKAQRRADIERRAILLDPPLTADVLAHIPSFQAALQLITPLDDSAWELLKPRLLAQREDAEQRVKQTSAKTQVLREKLGKKESEKQSVREPREVTDEEWDEIQGPVRARIAEYADEVIEGWNNGAKIKKRTCPQFAAEVLLYVRKRFYAEVAKDTAALIAAGKEPIAEPPEGPWTQRLTLENMKWIFDIKVKSHTEPLRKELFLCNGCNGGTGALKFFGFEGVLQHYAAKHTTALSLGNVVVHWRAEWPEVPPFCPDPRMKEKVYHEKGPSRMQQPKDAPFQHAYPNLQQGAPTGYLPPAYGVEPPPLPHYNSGPHMPMTPMAPYGQAGPHTYGPPFSTQTYPESTVYGSYTPLYPSGMPYGSQTHSNDYDYATSAPPPLEQFDNGPYSNHNNTKHAAAPGIHQQTQHETLTRSTQSAWSKVGSNKRVPPPVRALAVIHDAAKRFEETHHEPLQLEMFIDATEKSRKLHMVRSLNGVACRACDSEIFHLPKLARHFQAVHVELPRSQGQMPMNWLTDMIKLPEQERLAGLADILREDSAAYSLVEEAIPWAFEQAFIDKFASKPPKTKAKESLSIQETKQLPARDPYVISNQPVEERSWTGITQHKTTTQLGHDVPAIQSHSAVPPIAASLDSRLQDESEQDIAHLRPASEVYGRKTRQVPPVQPIPDDPAEMDASRSDEYSPSDFERIREPARGSGKTEQDFAAHRSSHPAKPQHWRDEQSSDHRDIREKRYSGVEPARQQDRSASVGNRPREHHHTATTSVNAVSSYVEAGETLGVQKHQVVEEEEEEVVYVDESGREIGRGRRARNTLPREPRYVIPGERRFGEYDQPLPLWHSDHYPVHYRERSPRSRLTQPGYYQEPEPPIAARGPYYDHPSTRLPTEYPTETFELVEVRHPDGDYFVRRPVRREDRHSYVYGTRPPFREQSAYPTQRVMKGPLGYTADSRGNPPGPPSVSRPAYDGYDRRYPSSAGKGSQAYFRG
ncbi:unnamed protein product [Fusarium equiseti]|uniref:DUF7892 domain-containing protein n=1 Tax=Fusarium equiseti TaxID=61235 RepID=A0A8J2IX35_FUSEQ|nr:unnamed protein product [Fusarium equiseti]